MRTKIGLLVIVGLGLLCTGALWATGTTEAKAVTLTWYYPGTYPQRDQDEVFAQFNTMLKQKMNVTIDFKPTPIGDYNQKMQAVIGSGEKYDLCFTANWINSYLHNVAKGAFVPLDDLFTKYAPKLKASVPDKIWAAARVNGKIYGIINYQVSAMTAGLLFQTGLLTKYTFDVTTVKKLEDIEPYLKAVRDGEPDLAEALGVANTAGTTIGYLNQYFGFEEIGDRAIPGAILDADPAMKVVNQFKTDRFRNWLKLMRDWYVKGYIMKDAIAVRDLDPNLTAAEIGVWFSGNYKPGGDAEESAHYGYPIMEIPISAPELITSSITSTMHAISITSPNPERAMAFMELMNTDKAQYNLLAFGIEGKHYTKTGANAIAPVADSAYWPGTAWLHASTFNAFLLPGQSADVWEKTKTFNMTAKPSPIIGFSFNPEPVQPEISQCQSVRQEYLPALELGTVDPAKVLPEFLDKLEKAGAQKIIDEMQRQIDAWKA